MTRWHDPACSTPDVVLNSGNWPTCRNCGKTCHSLNDLLAQNAADGFSMVDMPPDEEPGKLNLWWPSTVPYNAKFGTHGNTAHPSLKPPSGLHHPNQHIYGEALGASEFRLLCLSPVDDVDYPVHVGLETYLGDTHPDYEATSYCWGGEDGDYSLQKPVFIGSYWDVKLQTRSCWSMLRFLRPWRGLRIVFVDALCINQQDLNEKAVQVNKMAGIYEGCTRVVVYLGEDIVTSANPLRPSRTLDKIQSESKGSEFPQNHPLSCQPFGLGELFARKYFSRIWVIQELLLAQYAIVPIGNVTYRMTAAIVAELWDQTQDSTGNPTVLPPWMSILHYVHRSAQGKRMVPVLRLTRNSQASDPRDSLYGILSLIDTNIRPDYSISYRHFLIGVAAHLLLEEQWLGLLLKARTIIHPGEDQFDCLPSWTPHLNDSG
ncbi:hypothetical protein M011DRAFT_380387, partial [Sporormia fimetaria CBS 119925]